MDIAPDVTLWRGGVVEQDGQPESGPACYLFQETTIAFSSLLRILIQNPTYLDPRLYELLREEFRKYYMWNEGFCTGTGDLDQILSSSKNLKGTILNLMVLWARALSKSMVCTNVPRVRTMSQYDWTTLLSNFADLKVLSYKVDQVARAAVIDMKSHCSAVSALDTGYDSDSESDTESFASDEDVDEIIEDMKAYMESLMDFSLSLDHPAVDTVIIEDLGTTLVDDFSGVSEPARPFVLIIKDRFPSLDIGLVQKLGEVNWQRRQRLREKLTSAPVMTENLILGDDNSSSADTVVGRQHQNVPDTATLASTVRSILSIPSTYQSITTGSGFSDPSVFDNQSAVAPRASRPYSYAESMTSFATSRADELEYGQRRIPNMPDHEYDAPFPCYICGDMLTRIRHRADWKKHVYDDLEPYLCLTTDCKLGMKTFKSRGEWTAHEFQNHRVTSEWSCNLCSETFDSEKMFWDHFNSVHFQDVTQSQIEEVMSTSKRLIPRNAASEKCPFCLTIPGTNQKTFASHVGKHLQDLSLAALPSLDDPAEDGSSDDSDDGDDDHSENASDKEEDKNGGSDSESGSSSEVSIETVTSLQGKERPKRPDPDLPRRGVGEGEAADSSTVVMTDEKSYERMWVTESLGLLTTKSLDPNSSSPHTSYSTSPPKSSILTESQNTSPTSNINPGLVIYSPSPTQKSTSFDALSPEVVGVPSQLSESVSPTYAGHKHSLSHDNQSSTTFTSGSQNRLAFSVKDFERTLSRCTRQVESTPSLPSEKMPLLMASFWKELDSLSTLVQNLTSSSSGLSNHTIEKAIETLAICRAQLLRLERFLESTNSNLEKLQKKSKRQSSGLSRFFGRPTSTDLFDSSKGETILADLRSGRSALAELIPEVPSRVNLQELEAINPPLAESSPEPRLSLFSTSSLQPVMHSSFEIEAQKLAQIPDDVNDDSGVESALLKLEGKFELGQDLDTSPIEGSTWFNDNVDDD